MLVVMARHPEAGRVKTRLAASIGAGAALRVYRAFLRDLGDALGRDPRWRFRWCFTPPDAPFAEEVAAGLEAVPQRGGDLGARMRAALEAALRRAPAAVVIGSDLPHLAPRVLAEAFGLLRGAADVVLGPAEDGGYYLIGAAQRVPSLFEGIPWGGPEVLAATRSRAREAGLRLREVSSLYDVDGIGDLRRLAADPAIDRRPATRSVCEELFPEIRRGMP